MRPICVEAVIIGSGMSGASVAAELVKRGVRVAVLEIGRTLSLAHINSKASSEALQEPSLDPSFTPFGHNRTSTAAYGGSSGLRVRTGGRSLYWRGIVLEIEDYALESWPTEIRNGLGKGHKVGAYAKAAGSIEEWMDRALSEPADDRERQLLDRCHELGFASAVATPRAVVSRGGPQYAAYSPIRDLPRELIRHERRLFGSSSIHDDHVDLDVAIPNGAERYRAKVVVLCAGTIANVVLLRQLAALTDMSLPSRYSVVDHHLHGWLLYRGERYEGGLPSSVLLERSETAFTNVFAETIPFGQVEILDVYAMGEQLGSPSSTFSPQADGRADFAVGLTTRDEAVLAAQHELLRSAADRVGARLAGGTSSDQLPELLGPAIQSSIANQNVAIPYHFPLGTAQHEAGSLPLDGSVIDGNGQVRGLPRVFVAGPALFPRSGAANPGLTILALSRILASTVASTL